MGVQRDVIPLAEGERGGQRPPKQQSGQQSEFRTDAPHPIPRLDRHNNFSIKGGRGRPPLRYCCHQALFLIFKKVF